MIHVLPPVRPLRPSPGGQLAADDVVGRDDDAARAWERLEAASLRLNEPRRIGKTSLITKLAAAPPPEWRCVAQSFQGVDTVEEMAARALAAIRDHQSLGKRVRDRAAAFLRTAKVTATVEAVTFELSAAAATDPLRALDLAFRDVADALPGERLLLAWDEVPDMVLAIRAKQGLDAAARLLAVLRRFRDTDPRAPIRWLITGSVGLHHVLRDIPNGDGLVNDLDSLPLGPLDEEWATWLAASVLSGAGVRFDDATPATLGAVCGGIAYLIQLAAACARDTGVIRLCASDVEPLFDAAVADLDASHQATHLLSRVGAYYGDHTRLAEAILDRVARGPATRSELLRLGQRGRRPTTEEHAGKVLDWLVLDHYLVRRAGGSRAYEWRYPPLERVWRIRRG